MRAREKSFARELSCDMLRAESSAAEHFFHREFFYEEFE